MSRFAALKKASVATPATVADTTDVAAQQPMPQRIPVNSRDGKKAVVGYFSPGLSKALRLLALQQDSSIQALLGEAIDDLLRKHGGHPFGER
jgi:hypothetical protein